MIKLAGHTDTINSIAISNCEEKIISGGVDSELKIWDLNTQSCINSIKNKFSIINCIRCSVEDRLVVACGSNKKIQIWDYRAPKEQININCDAYGNLYSLALPSTYKVLNYKNLLRYSLNNKNGSFTINKTSCFVGCEDGSIVEWDVRHLNQPLSVAKAHSFDVRSLDIHPSGSYLVSSSFDKNVKVLDAKNLTVYNTYKVHNDRLISAEWHPLFPIMLTCSYDNTVKFLGSKQFLSEYN